MTPETPKFALPSIDDLFGVYCYAWGGSLLSESRTEFLDRCFQDTMLAWNNLRRHEHTLNNHLLPILKAILGSAAADPLVFYSEERVQAILLGAFYHDFVYNTEIPDSTNVAASAQQMREHAKCICCGAVEDPAIINFLGLVGDEIDGTDYTRYGAGLRLPDPDSLALMDFDLMGLGGTYEEFRQHSARVRREWPHVSDHQFRLGRMAFLAKFLRFPRLFHPRLAELEAQAKANMGRELAELLGGDPLSFRDLEEATELAQGAPLAFSIPLLAGCLREGEAYVVKLMQKHCEEDEAPETHHHGIPQRKATKQPRKK